MILDLLRHNFEKAHELYGDRWLGFAESDLHRWLEAAGFKKIEISIVAAEEQPPHFQTILAGGEKSEFRSSRGDETQNFQPEVSLLTSAAYGY